MEKEKSMLEMLKQMNITMLEMDKILGSVQQTQNEMQKEMSQRFDAVETRLESVETSFESVETRLESVETHLVIVENTVKSLGEMFEHTVKNQLESDEKLHKTIMYLTHKVTEHDKEIFNMNNKHI